ncbi:MAG: MBL fold metallo-hydrolase RNA specificity domain-containing protein, partial [Halodesulfurarchaeum sp.]
VRISLPDGKTIVADSGSPDGDLALLSHAHGDHLYVDPPEEVIASDVTHALAAKRRSETRTPDRTGDPDVEPFDSGHVPGSRAFLVEADRRYLYTGDVSVRDRFFLDGFSPPSADVLIVESTYGRPEYTFPPQEEVEATIVDWLEDTADTPVLLMGYALGRAQELQVLADRADRNRIFVTDAIEQIDQVLEETTAATFRRESYSADVTLRAGDALVLPSQTNYLDFVERIRERTGALKAGFSGWAVDDSYRFARDLDVSVPLSDHCDFEELLSLIEAVDPAVVYTVHGFVDELAQAITTELGYPSQSLKPNQTTLSEF